MSTTRAGSIVDRLHQLVGAEGEAIAPALAATPGEDVLGPLVAAAAAQRGNAADYALVVESVLEGYLLHFGRTRLLETADEDLRLLAGDYMYALGLSRLARLGDLPAVQALADLITLCARHQAGGAGDPDLLEGLWMLTALAVGGGSWQEYGDSIARARQGHAEAGRLLAEVSKRAAQTGVGLEAHHALIAFRQVASTAPRT
jgi:hypothetical protein